MKLPARYAPKSVKNGGGMSRVTLCHDTRLDRDVIVKAVANDIDKGRLLDEIKALQSIRSGYVVQIYDVIRESGDIVAIVEEHCPGSDLADLMGGLTEQQFYKFGYQLSSGIAEIHGCGVIHRDIKPQNVRMSESSCLTIIDFGLARLTGDDAKTVSQIGTSGYMAPELFEPDSNGDIEFTEAVDVFAFGSSMFALATGSLPLDVRRRPPRLPCAALTFSSTPFALDPRLRASLDQCFNTNPALRPSAGDLASEFRRILLRNRHRALVNINGTANYLDASNRTVTASVTGIASITIEYNGDHFLASQVSGDVFVNNMKIAAGYVFPGSCVIAFGGPELQARRVYVTFDVSHPGVEV